MGMVGSPVDILEHIELSTDFFAGALVINTVHWLWIVRAKSCRFFVMPPGKWVWLDNACGTSVIVMMAFDWLGLTPRYSGMLVMSWWLCAWLLLSIVLRHVGRHAPDEA